ncbi:MAG: hypothetical protein R2795_17695 [Saprospiraceae bacterium]
MVLNPCLSKYPLPGDPEFDPFGAGMAIISMHHHAFDPHRVPILVTA